MKIDKCIYNCPLQQSDMQGMYCNHPCFENKGFLAARIITRDNGVKGVPKECPLRKQDLKVSYTIKLKKGI